MNKTILVLMFLIVTLISFNVSAQSFQDKNFELDVIETLGPFPELGSEDEKRDVEVLLAFQKARTKSQCEKASLEAKANLENFFGGSGGVLTDEEVKSVKHQLTKALIRTGLDIELTKVYFNRQRPYVTHPEITPCIPLEKSKAYPSGHAALAQMYAVVLGEFFPERRFQLLKRAEEVAIIRVLGGVHHPSDIVAGKKLGNLLAEKFLTKED
jgi:acid phosphatase (class A)